MNKWIFIVGAVAIVGVGALFFLRGEPAVAPSSNSVANLSINTNTPRTVTPDFSDPKKSAHYQSNTPAHGVILPAPPINVVIDFNFDLAPASSIAVMSGDKDYATGQTSVDANKLAMRRSLDPAMPDGMYRVEYDACWPDGSCHEGYFEFAVDRTRAAAWEDLTGRTEVTVALRVESFQPRNIRVSRGTRVVWVNEDTTNHYINTDSHPAHTYYPAQNSTELKPGDRFQTEFTQAGVYPYHCSAHADTMTGMILVE